MRQAPAVKPTIRRKRISPLPTSHFLFAVPREIACASHHHVFSFLFLSFSFLRVSDCATYDDHMQKDDEMRFSLSFITSHNPTEIAAKSIYMNSKTVILHTLKTHLVRSRRRTPTPLIFSSFKQQHQPEERKTMNKSMTSSLLALALISSVLFAFMPQSTEAGCGCNQWCWDHGWTWGICGDGHTCICYNQRWRGRRSLESNSAASSPLSSSDSATYTVNEVNVFGDV